MWVEISNVHGNEYSFINSFKFITEKKFIKFYISSHP